MPTHSTSAYKDGQKWIVFCEKCGVEEPFESQECSEIFYCKTEEQLKAVREKIPFKSGLPLDESERNK
jgi:hypothetical protein